MSEEQSFSDWEHIPSPTHSTQPDTFVNEDNGNHHDDNREEDNSSHYSYSSSSSWDCDEEGSQQNMQMGLAKEVVKHVRLNFEVMCNRVVNIVGRARCYAKCKGELCRFLSFSGVVVAVLASFVYVKIRELRLVSMIKKKDEKISQLLLQVAQMNEMLSGRRRVQVLRVQYV